MLLLLARLALADVVSDEPIDCPAGAIEQANHIGTWCAPAPSCDVAECVGSCRTTGLCVTEEEVACGGMQPDTGEPCTFLKVEAHGRCRSQRDCDVGACLVEERCAEAGPLSCGGCATSSPGGAAAMLGLALLGLASRAGRAASRGSGLPEGDP